MFWGLTLESGKRYSQIVDTTFHLSMAALEPTTKDLPKNARHVSVLIEHGKVEFLLCTLEYDRVMQMNLDLMFVEGEEVSFFLNGEGTVHLTGYVLDGDEAQLGDELELTEPSEEDDEDDDESDENESGDENFVQKLAKFGDDVEDTDEEWTPAKKRKKMLTDSIHSPAQAKLSKKNIQKQKVKQSLGQSLNQQVEVVEASALAKKEKPSILDKAESDESSEVESSVGSTYSLPYTDGDDDVSDEDEEEEDEEEEEEEDDEEEEESEEESVLEVYRKGPKHNAQLQKMPNKKNRNQIQELNQSSSKKSKVKNADDSVQNKQQTPLQKKKSENISPVQKKKKNKQANDSPRKMDEEGEAVSENGDGDENVMSGSKRKRMQQLQKQSDKALRGEIQGMINELKKRKGETPSKSGSPSKQQTNAASSERKNSPKSSANTPEQKKAEHGQEDTQIKSLSGKKAKKAKLQNGTPPSPKVPTLESPTKSPNVGGKTPKGEKKTLQGGLVIEDSRVGNGPVAKNGKFVHVYYTGKLPSNEEFDSVQKGKPFSFRLGRGEVIKGWELGIEGMRVGGKRKITVPPSLGYGNKRVGPIPSNSTLHFEVELKAVN